MNKKLLTAAMLTSMTGAAHAQSSVLLYGVIDAGISYVNHSKSATGSDKLFKFDEGVPQGSRWGLRGTEDLGGGTKAIFVLENGFNVGTGALGQGGRLFGRQAWVGLSQNNVGSLTFGRQYTLTTDVLGANFTAGSNTVAGNYAYHINDIDQLTSSRIDNAVKFQSANYAGLSFGALYGFSNQTQFAGTPGKPAVGGTPAVPATPSTYSFGLNYANGPYGLGAAYTNIRYAGKASIANFTSSELRSLRSYGVGGRYVIGHANLWALWTNTHLDPITGGGLTINNYEVGGKYMFTPAFSAAAGYTYTRLSDTIHGHYNQVNGALDYAFSKRTDVYLLAIYQDASGKLANGTPLQAQIGTSTSYFNTSGTGAQNQFAVRVGIRHKF